MRVSRKQHQMEWSSAPKLHHEMEWSSVPELPWKSSAAVGWTGSSLGLLGLCFLQRMGDEADWGRGPAVNLLRGKGFICIILVMWYSRRQEAR